MNDLPSVDPEILYAFDQDNNVDPNLDEIMPDNAKPAAHSNLGEIMPYNAKPAAPSNRDEIMPDNAKPAAARGESSFTIPPSKQLRGKTYFVHDQLTKPGSHDQAWVMTKPGSHFPVMLKGTQVGDAIRISVLYKHKDHIGDRVKCENLRERHETVFDVEPRTPGLQPAPHHDNLTVYSKTLFNAECQSDEVTLRFKPNCLNSCSKPNSCSDRLLKFELLSKDGIILATSTWNLRVCAGLSRDFNNTIDSVDHNTGEKRKPLYSKTSKDKKIKKEHEELAPANAEQEHQDTQSCSATRRDHEVVKTAFNWVTSGAALDQPSSSGEGDMTEEMIHDFNPEAFTPLLEEKGITLYVEKGHQPTRTSMAPHPFRCNSFNVQMEDDMEAEVVKGLILLFGGKVRELTHET